ncbi:MAG: alpha-2-macroglobulin [bacterium]|nr:alpha-2-macroglobulin [bacterium]
MNFRVTLRFLFTLIALTAWGSQAAPLYQVNVSQQTVAGGDVLLSPVLDFPFPAAHDARALAGADTRAGYKMTLHPGEGVLMLTRQRVETSGPAAAVAEYDILEGDANVAAIAFNSPVDFPDGQIGLVQRMSHGAPTPGAVERLIALFDAPSGFMQPGVQVVNDTGADAVVMVYSLAAYAMEDGAGKPVETDPRGDFSEVDVSALRTNINQDAGEAVYDAVAGNLRLSAEGGAAANAALRVIEPDSINDDQLLTAKVKTIRSGGSDGMFASLFYSASWAAGVFIRNDNLPENESELIYGGGGNFFAARDEALDLVVQNGGGQQSVSVWVDDVSVEALSVSGAIAGLSALDPPAPEKALSAALVVPKEFFAGSQSSFTLTTLDASDRAPVSVPYSVTLSRGDERLTLGAGVTGGDGLAASTFTTPRAATGEWTLEVSTMGKTIAKGPASLTEGGLLIVETDKPIYRPGQTIQGRVVFLNNALTPLGGEIEISISDAKGIRIFKTTAAANEYGVASFELPLASELNYGTWKITATSGSGVKSEADIEVDRYVLPSFNVDLSTEKEWVLPNQPIRGVVESNYFFGQPVQGAVTVEALRYVSTWETYATATVAMTDGRAEFELPEVGYAAGTVNAGGDSNVQLKISVTDEGGKTDTTDALLRVVKAGVTLRLINDSPVIKPGLQQELIVTSTTPDGTPMSIPVEIEAAFTTEDGKELSRVNTTVETQNGLARYTYTTPETTAIATFLARATVDKQTAEEALALNAAYSPGAHYIHVRQRDEGVLAVGSTAVFDVFATNPGTVFYEVTVNGRSLLSSTSDNGEIAFPVTPAMSGEGRLLVYMIQPNNEVSADVLPFEVELTAPAGLQVGFDVDETRPGGAVTLSVQSAGRAMLGVSIVDESVYALAEGRLNLPNVFAELERIFMEPKQETHDNPDGGRFFYSMPALKGAKDLLADNNLQMIASSSLTIPEGRELNPWLLFNNELIRGALPPALFPFPEDAVNAGGDKSNEYQAPDRVRSYFPETWLWNPEWETGENGSASMDLTAPDSITTWKVKATSTGPGGLGLAETSLRVFQDFFVEPDLPYAVIRGDRFPLRARVFNYSSEAQTVRLTLAANPALGVEDDLVQDVPVPANGVAGATFTLQPSKVGTLPIELTAQTASRADAIKKDLRVEPEGARREITRNGIIKDATSIEISLAPPVFIDPVLDQEIPPLEIVPDSERLRVAVTGSLLGQSMTGLGDLVGMPYGCGEQNMIFLAPDVEVLRYLRATGQSNPELRAQLEYFITTGYQRELTFQHDDGSFSAFGEQDEEGSLWLTSFVLSVFSKAREVYAIDDAVLAEAAGWIVSHQKDDGSWPPVGLVIHQEMDGGVEGDLALTAYVVNALLEYGGADEAAVARGVEYLAQHVNEAENAYVLALSVYALTQADSSAADGALERLLEKGVNDRDGLHWEPHAIETTGYAILSLISRDRVEAQSALEWLSAQRNGLGGYGNTQDTVIALKALTAAAIRQSRDLDSTIDVVIGGETVHTFTVNSVNFDVLQTVDLPPAQNVTLVQRGEGSVVYQAMYAYNIPVSEPVQKDDVTLSVTYNADHIEVNDLVDVLVSVMYAGSEKTSGMTLVDVSVPTGFAVEQESIDRLMELDVMKRVETAGRKVIFYLDALSPGDPFDFKFQIRALFPVKADTGVSQAYLYYDPDARAETSGGELIVQ